VLINGASGGVGTMAVQIAKALGADDFADGGPHYDVMLDNVGNRSTEDCLSVLRPEGRYVQTSGPKENRWFGPMLSIVGRALRFRRASQSFHQFTADPNQEDMAYLAELLESGALVPQIQRTPTGWW
jgi:NADPH:quinone reductase-like Zn-dependent oxidoreductase